MFLLLLVERAEVLNLTAEHFQLIPKVVLLHEFDDYVHVVWDRLPDHIRADPAVQECRLCETHHDHPNPPMIKDCHECIRLRATAQHNGA